MITDKAKEEFEKWYVRNEFERPIRMLSEFYYDLTDSMKYGVLVDWFDSVGIKITIEIWYEKELFEVRINGEYQFEDLTRTQARQKAIEKANEIFNNR